MAKKLGTCRWQLVFRLHNIMISPMMTRLKQNNNKKTINFIIFYGLAKRKGRLSGFFQRENTFMVGKVDCGFPLQCDTRRAIRWSLVSMIINIHDPNAFSNIIQCTLFNRKLNYSESIIFFLSIGSIWMSRHRSKQMSSNHGTGCIHWMTPNDTHYSLSNVLLVDWTIHRIEQVYVLVLVKFNDQLVMFCLQKVLFHSTPMICWQKRRVCHRKRFAWLQFIAMANMSIIITMYDYYILIVPFCHFE